MQRNSIVIIRKFMFIQKTIFYRFTQFLIIKLGYKTTLQQ